MYFTRRSHLVEQNKSTSRMKKVVTLKVMKVSYAGAKSARNISTNLSPNPVRLTTLF